MDKIYSRPRVKVFYSTSEKNKKKIAVIIVMIITIITVISIVKSLDPIFKNLCKNKAIEMATQILNEESTKVLKKHNYRNIVSIEKTEENNILKTDVSIINEIASDLETEVTKGLKNLADEKVKIPIGAFLGNSYLAGFGPKINIKIIPSGTVTTELKTEFKSQGINQTIYRIYLEVVCNESIVTSYNSIDTKIVNQVLLVETVIVGNVPQTYYNLEGINRENSIDIIE